jgi:hypothetical protein
MWESPHAVDCIPSRAVVLIVFLQALQGLESPAVEKQESAWPACRDVLARGAVLYQQLDFVAAALMERARKHEHVPKLAALIAKYAEEKCNSTQLVREQPLVLRHDVCGSVRRSSPGVMLAHAGG